MIANRRKARSKHDRRAPNICKPINAKPGRNAIAGSATTQSQVETCQRSANQIDATPGRHTINRLLPIDATLSQGAKNWQTIRRKARCKKVAIICHPDVGPWFLYILGRQSVLGSVTLPIWFMSTRLNFATGGSNYALLASYLSGHELGHDVGHLSFC